MNLANRLKRLEERLGPPPPPILEQVWKLAWARALTPQEARAMDERLRASGTLTLGEFFGGETEEFLNRLRRAADEAAQKLTGKSYKELCEDAET